MTVSVWSEAGKIGCEVTWFWFVRENRGHMSIITQIERATKSTTLKKNKKNVKKKQKTPPQ